LCFVNVFVFASKINDLGGRQGDTARALARYHHPLASSEALYVRYWAMHHALYRRIRMAIKIASNLPDFFVAVDFIVGHNLR
jgi:hypothetical protein